MKFVAGENFPRVALLPSQRLPDTEVLAIASAEGRTLLPFDKDFGELAFRRGLPASCGIILFRTGSLTPTESADLALATLQSGAAWAGHFCVVSDRKIRITPLPLSLRD